MMVVHGGGENRCCTRRDGQTLPFFPMVATVMLILLKCWLWLLLLLVVRMAKSTGCSCSGYDCVMPYP